MWHPEQWASSSEFGAIVGIIERLSKREKQLFSLGLILLFIGTVLQGLGLWLNPP